MQNLTPSIESKKGKFNYKILVIIVAAMILVASSFGVGFQIGLEKGVSNKELVAKDEEAVEYGEVKNKEKIPKFLTENVDFGLLDNVWELINKKYVEAPVPETQLFYGAVAGSVASLGDPYSVFFEPQISSEFQEELKGKFEGIGAEIAIKKERLTIVAPLPDSPAERAGLKAGDKVFKIDDYDTTGISLDEAVKRIRGPKGTKVVLSVWRENKKEETLEIEIIRDEIKFKSVKWEMKEGNIGYIKVSHFNEDTSRVFKQAVDDVLARNPRGIILDLRNNPGGYLERAIDMASYWVDQGPIVVEQFGKNYQEEALPIDKRRVYGSTLDPVLKGKKTVILINKGSASGSEIVAGALQDYGLATLVGERTFGKGSVQELEELSNGSSVKITVAKWLTPNGRAIDKEGIAPDIEVELTDEDYNEDRDPQLDKAIELLSNQVIK